MKTKFFLACLLFSPHKIHRNTFVSKIFISKKYRMSKNFAYLSRVDLFFKKFHELSLQRKKTNLLIYVPWLCCIVMVFLVVWSLERLPNLIIKSLSFLDAKLEMRYRYFSPHIMYLFLLFRETWVCQFGLVRANKVVCALTCLRIVHFDLSPLDGRSWQSTAWDIQERINALQA